MGSWEGHCSGTAMGTAIDGVSAGQALLRLLTVSVLLLVLSAAYCVLESAAGLEEDRLSDLSPFLRVGVRGMGGGRWAGVGGRRGEEGPACGKVSGAALGAHRSRSIKMGSPTDWHLGSSAIRNAAHAAATLAGRVGGLDLSGRRPQISDLRPQTPDFRRLSHRGWRAGMCLRTNLGHATGHATVPESGVIAGWQGAVQ